MAGLQRVARRIGLAVRWCREQPALIVPWCLVAALVAVSARGQGDRVDPWAGYNDVISIQRFVRPIDGYVAPMDVDHHDVHVAWTDRGTRREVLYIHVTAELTANLSPAEAERRAREIFRMLYALHMGMRADWDNAMIRIRIDLDPAESEWHWASIDTGQPFLVLPVAENVTVTTGRGHNPNFSQWAGPVTH